MHSQQHNNVNSYVSEYASSLESLVNAVAPDKLSIVVQVLLVMAVFMNPSLLVFVASECKFCRATLLRLQSNMLVNIRTN